MMYSTNVNEYLKGTNITKEENSLLYVAKKEIAIPKKKIIIAKDMGEVTKYLNEYKGGIIL